MTVFEELKVKAASAGTNLTEVCREAKVKRQVVESWKDKDPKTIQILRRLEKVIDRKAKTNNSSDVLTKVKKAVE